MLVKYILENLSLLKYRKKVMYIIPELKFWCLLVPKAGSTSIKILLCNKLKLDTLNPDDSLLPFRVWISDFRECVYAKFSIVRHPVSRIYSCYKHVYLRSPQKWKLVRFRYLPSTLLFHKHLTFSDFINKIKKIPRCLRDQHFESQFSQLSHKGSLLIENDFIFHLEDRDRIDAFLISIGLWKMIHKNKSENENLSIDNYAINLISRLYKEDFTNFNYDIKNAK